MALLRFLIISIILGLLTGCHFTYLVKSGYYQAQVLSRQKSIESILNDPNTDPKIRAKLELALDVLNFMESDLKLNTKGNYKSFVQLDDKYVTYIVSAAPKFQLEPYYWSFPLVGKVPYKGFFEHEDAQAEANELKDKNYDTMVRGVSAYSSLGWLKDPLLSSMLNYSDEDFVNLLIHETIHANLFIKSQADFNEQLATFLGNVGTEYYYKSKKNQASLKKIELAREDDLIFSKFITEEIKSLEQFYLVQRTEEDRAKNFLEIQARFKKKVNPKLQIRNYGISNEPLNNAVLIGLKTYMQDLNEFEAAFQKFGRDFYAFFEYCKTLENAKNPKGDLQTKAL